MALLHTRHQIPSRENTDISAVASIPAVTNQEPTCSWQEKDSCSVSKPIPSTAVWAMESIIIELLQLRNGEFILHKPVHTPTAHPLGLISLQVEITYDIHKLKGSIGQRTIGCYWSFKPIKLIALIYMWFPLMTDRLWNATPHMQLWAEKEHEWSILDTLYLHHQLDSIRKEETTFHD